jgi:2-phosphosulfolactate phosphatase
MIDVAFIGTAVRPASTAVVIDVLRATSTITMALSSGYERVLVAGGIEHARALRADERVLAGEVECEMPEGFDLGNSPGDTREPKGPVLILATTNGAPAIVSAAESCDVVLIASLLNLDAIVAELAQVEGDVLLVCAGTNGAVTLEDVYVAGRISAALEGDRTDAARVAEAVAAAFPKPLDALDASAGSVGLYAADLAKDIEFCAQESITGTVPRLVSTIDGVPVLEAPPHGAEASPAETVGTTPSSGDS